MSLSLAELVQKQQNRNLHGAVCISVVFYSPMPVLKRVTSSIWPGVPPQPVPVPPWGPSRPPTPQTLAQFALQPKLGPEKPLLISRTGGTCNTSVNPSVSCGLGVLMVCPWGSIGSHGPSLEVLWKESCLCGGRGSGYTGNLRPEPKTALKIPVAKNHHVLKERSRREEQEAARFQLC